MKICAITNVYNEAQNLPVWAGYYGRQLGPESLFVLDHGSDDGSTDALDPATTVLRLPRHKPFRGEYRFDLVNDLVNGLVPFYDWVIYTDADEILVADPARHDGLRGYLAATGKDTCYAIGLNLRHLVSQEAPLEPGDTILRKRTTVQFVSGMCKPLVTRQPLRWMHGFHGADVEPSFDDLYLFHLRHADLDWARARMEVTRTVDFENREVERYRLSDAELVRREYEGFDARPIDEAFDLSRHLREQHARYKRRGKGIWSVLPRYVGQNLHRVPERFRDAF